MRRAHCCIRRARRPSLLSPHPCLRYASSSHSPFHRSLSTSPPSQLSPPTDPPLYDVCIVGGGLVGASFALALASSPLTRHLSLCLLEPNTSTTHPTPSPAPLPPSGPPSLRTLSLSPSTYSFLSSLDVFSHFPPTRLTPFTRMLVWQVTPGHIRWEAGETDQIVLGYSVETDLLLRAVYGRIHRLQQEGAPPTRPPPAHPPRGVSLITGVTVGGVKLPAPPAVDDWRDLSPVPPDSPAPVVYPTVRLSDGRELRCRLLVGSDGANSFTQRAMETPVVGWDYSQRAVVCNVRLSDGEEMRTAYQRFLPTGPIAMLPCHERYASVIWSTTALHSQQLTKMGEGELLRHINAAFQSHSVGEEEAGGWVDAVLPIRPLIPVLFPDPFRPSPSVSSLLPPLAQALASPVASFPLRYLRALPSPLQSPRLLLLGDAAQVMHPLAGQGMNAALREVEKRVGEVERKVEGGGEVGVEVGGRGLGMGEGVDLLWRLFHMGRGDGEGVVNRLRGVGLRLFNAMADVKYAVAQQSMGTRRSR